MVGVSSGRGICKQSQSDRFKGPDQEKETRLMLNRNQGKRKGPDELAMTCRRKSNQRPSKDKTRGVTVRKSTVDTRARVVRGEMEDEMRMTVRDESHDPGAEVQKSRRKEKKKRDTTRGAMKKSRRGGADAANAKHDALALQPRSGMICSSTPYTEEDTHRYTQIQTETHRLHRLHGIVIGTPISSPTPCCPPAWPVQSTSPSTRPWTPWGTCLG